MILDEIDKKIISKLQENAKATIKEIALDLNLTNTPVYERIKKMELAGVIKKYTTIVDKKQLGYQFTVFCSVTLDKHKSDFISNFENEVRELKEVSECYHTAGIFDYLLKINVKDMADYQHFITQKLASISNIGKVQSSFIMTELKNDLSLPE
mgnify:CR=1 FL=1